MVCIVLAKCDHVFSVRCVAGHALSMRNVAWLWHSEEHLGSRICLWYAVVRLVPWLCFVVIVSEPVSWAHFLPQLSEGQ